MVSTRYPLQLGIALVFTLLISILGVTLVWYNYAGNKNLALIAANDVFARITRQTETNIRELYAPAEALVDLTTQLDVIESDSFSERLRLLGYLAEALSISETISSLYIGYEDGQFFQVRVIGGDARVREAFGAPESAHLVVVSDEPDPTGPVRKLLFYDRGLTLLSATPPVPSDYDPRTRPWYQAAVETPRQIGSGFYVFHAPPVVGTTIARRSPNRRAVVGADLTLDALSVGIGKERVTPSSEILVFDAGGTVIAYPGEGGAVRIDDSGPEPTVRQAKLNELAAPVFQELSRRHNEGISAGQLSFSTAGRDWMGSISQLPLRSGNEVYLAILVPQDELLAGIASLRTRSVFISLALLVVAIAVVWWISRRIARSLRALSKEAHQIRQFDLDSPVTVRSSFLEVDELATTMDIMKSAIHHFVEISKGLSAEKDFDRLLESLLDEARTTCRADGGSILLFDDEEQTLSLMVAVNERIGLHIAAAGGANVSSAPLILGPREATGIRRPVEEATVREGKTRVVDDIQLDSGLDYAHVRERYEREGYGCQSLLHLPLRNRQDEIIGVLELINARDPASDEITRFTSAVISYVEAFSSQAAITLDNRRLLKAQKDLLDSFIRLIAGAIDAKSPYTSGHCQRVPELARMLARAAHDSDSGPFADFALDDDEWYELHIASWLHDCGKVTTPEYVVDKATKLECIYDRIHEIRMRFEVLWRDAQIEYYQALAADAPDGRALKNGLDERFRKLQEDYAFLAECNIGGEFMAPERVERLREIGQETWLRHFDDRIGLSQDELARKDRTPKSTLPAQEYLLADKDEHIVPRHDAGRPFGDNPHGFRMAVPQHAYNYGELYNLSIARGTLTDEDRFKINEHIVQTIILLNKLPFPKELRRVPTWAGNHHEKLDGTGYPRQLTADELSVPERIMAIADIFEALTAADRPYKEPKPLSEAVRIMSFMRNDGHICPELFELFLESGVYKDYARAFLDTQQIDEVDIEQFVSREARAG